jgi:hypothetical protein
VVARWRSVPWSRVNTRAGSFIANRAQGGVTLSDDWISPVISALNLALYGILFGAIVGALMGVIFYALSGGQRDFASVSGTQAERYNVMVDAEVADQAERLLAGLRPA